MREITAGDGKSLAVRRVREALEFARKYFPRIEILHYPSDNDLIEAAMEIVRRHETGGYDVGEKGIAVLEGMEGNRTEATFTSIDGHEWVMQRVAGESRAEFEERARLFDDLKKSNGGRVPIVAEGSGDLVTDLGLPESTRTIWALVRGLNAMIEDLQMTPAEFAKDAGLPVQEVEKICDGVVNETMLARLIEIYDAAAWKSGRLMVRELIEEEMRNANFTEIAEMMVTPASLTKSWSSTRAPIWMR